MAKDKTVLPEVEKEAQAQVLNFALSDARTGPYDVQVLRSGALQQKLKGTVGLTFEALQKLRRFSEADRAEGLAALRQVSARGLAHPGELGDLGPDAQRAATVADIIEESGRTIAVLEGLLAHHKAIQVLAENEANQLIDEAAEESAKRVKRGLLGASDYDLVSKYLGLRGAAVAKGIAQAKAAKLAAAAPSADVSKVAPKPSPAEEPSAPRQDPAKATHEPPR